MVVHCTCTWTEWHLAAWTSTCISKRLRGQGGLSSHYEEPIRKLESGCLTDLTNQHAALGKWSCEVGDSQSHDRKSWVVRQGCHWTAFLGKTSLSICRRIFLLVMLGATCNIYVTRWKNVLAVKFAVILSVHEYACWAVGNCSIRHLEKIIRYKPVMGWHTIQESIKCSNSYTL